VFAADRFDARGHPKALKELGEQPNRVAVNLDRTRCLVL
jgi:hypothetical protein